MISDARAGYDRLRLTVVMTSYNECKTVARAYASARRIDVDSMELLIVDNGSTDGTQEILRHLQEQDTSTTFILHPKNMTLAHSVEIGLKTGHGRYTYIHHADDEYDTACVRPMLEWAEREQLDAVLGSRLVGRRGSTWALVQERTGWLGTVITTGLINFWYGKRFTDIIGSRLYRTEILRDDPITTWGPAFDFEIVSRICKRGQRIEEMAIGYTPRECQADKKTFWYHMIPALWVMVRIKYFDGWWRGRRP